LPYSYLGCSCPEGYVGPVCEFEDRGQEVEVCNLTCENHGICREGAKDVSILTNVQVTDEMKTAYNEDFEHCVCPSGYVGLQCQYQLDQCPGGAHVCLNGGDCVTVPNGTTVSYACDCTNAETNLSRFAGAFCEMESTQFCTIDQGKTHPGAGIDAYCTNGGKCLDFVPYYEK
jgi:EGF-like domain